MTSGQEWEESLDNIDELISCSLGSLETEDVIYLEEYLNGEGDLGSHSPGLWSALKERSERDVSASPKARQVKHVHTDQTDKHTDEEHSETIDDPQVALETASSSDSLGPGSDSLGPGSDSLGPGSDSLGPGSDTLGPGLSLRQIRATRGVPRPKFVSYQAFPPTKDKPFACEVCGRRLATRESRRRHIIAKHIKDRNHVCSFCGKSFVFKFSLKAHAAIHAATPNFTCVCGQTFSVRGSYMNHVRRVHQAVSEVKHSCELCFKSFVDYHTLRLHLVSVHKPKTIACLHEGCNKVFSTTALMKSHYWYHLKHRFPCDECGQTFSTESYMYKHRRTHSGIRPYLCVDCGKTYLSVSHLNKHRRAAHSSYRPFQCSYCGKCYKAKDQLTFHESSHRGEKPYQCEVCGYATSYRNTYYAHRKKHQTPSSTSLPQNKEKADLSSTTENIAGGKKSNNGGKKRDKKKTPREKVSKCNVSPGGLSSKTPTNNTEAPQTSQRDTTPSTIKTASDSTNVSPNTTSVNVICIMSGEPSNRSILSGGNRSFITSFPTPLDNQCKDIQSSASEPLSLVHPPGAEIPYPGVQESVKPESCAMTANADTPEEISKKNSEEQTSCIILTNAAKCSFPMCDSDESLLLVKVDDESYIALCTHHSLTNLAVVKEATSMKETASVNLDVAVLDNLGYQNETTEQETSDSAAQKGVTTETNLSESITHCQNSLELHEKHTPGVGSPVHFTSHSAATTPEICGSNVPASQPLDCVKPSSAVSLTEHLSTMMELDSGMGNLSGPIVDESFSLAQIEVHCPMCEEQFLCMDDYITHLESCHN